MDRTVLSELQMAEGRDATDNWSRVWATMVDEQMRFTIPMRLEKRAGCGRLSSGGRAFVVGEEARNEACKRVGRFVVGTTSR